MNKTLRSPGEGHRARLRERFLRVGLEGFDDHEALELLLTFAIARKDVKPLARSLLTLFGSYNGVLDASPAELERVPGIGPSAAAVLQIIRASCCRYLLQKVKPGTGFAHCDDMINFLRMKLGCGRTETMAVLFFNSRNVLLGYELFPGTLDRAALYPREVAAAALRVGAAGVILAHNHPSGQCTPSQQDVLLTTAVKDALRAVGILLYAHYIVTSNSYAAVGK